ncbi:MAG: hypothetical protein J0H29_06410 [Sphingobacteriales bacterium]|nr:hypothetical protein [Sphingobacteriales bacterium]
MIYDVLSNYVVDAKMGTTEKSEFTLIHDMLDNKCFNYNSILILDRGFSKFYFFIFISHPTTHIGHPLLTSRWSLA